MLSIPHMIVVFLVVLVVFGPQKLPELARSFGKLMAEFRKASNDFKNAFEEEMRDLERQARIAELKKQVAEANAAAAAAVNKAAEPAATSAETATLATPPSPPGPTEPSPESGVPVVNPVAESIPRLDAAVAETTAAVGVTEGTPGAAAVEGNSNGERVTEASPSHDQQQPA
ncbi:MAG TPA: twin-arginine translocase TatA/TatE family subunit [Dongiaceae bacterium]|nr:twin-arginine translocase TatA/TatE family subunit [Dongiaceae bacterium]